MDRIGHAGTLDPTATGLLLLLLGRATRLLPYLELEPKEYDAEIQFGAETDTDDAAGSVVRLADVPEEGLILASTRRLTGEIDQVPSAFSAKKSGGARAYRAARKGRPLALASARVQVHEWRSMHFQDGKLRAQVVCGGGTYIRALARDMGRLCGSAAHIAALRRTRIGHFRIEDAVSVSRLADAAVKVIPPLDAMRSIPKVILTEEFERMIIHGRRIPASDSASLAALLSADGRLVAVAERTDGEWKSKVVLADA
jgi:tRNA pseudouridine55 synthase